MSVRDALGLRCKTSVDGVVFSVVSGHDSMFSCNVSTSASSDYCTYHVEYCDLVFVKVN